MKHMLRIATILAILVSFGVAGGTRADANEPDIRALGEGGYRERIEAVERLAATGDPQLVPLLEALADRRLYVRKSDGTVVIGLTEGSQIRLHDPLTGADLGLVPSGEVKRIGVNNRLRGTISAAIGTLTLLSPDPEARRAAADAVLKARPDGTESILERAIAQESEKDVKERMTLALAAVQVTHAQDTATRVRALDILGGTANREVRDLVASLLVADASGKPSETDEAVRSAATEALERIDGRLQLWAIAGNIFQGLSLGSVLLLAAVGLAITFGVMGVINMAHGEMVMLGAYTTFVIQETIRASAPQLFDVSVLIAIPAAFIVAGAFGVVIEQTIIRFLYGRPLETLLATWGLSLILQQLIRSVFGPTNQEVGNPSWMSGALELTGGLVLTYNRIWIIAFSLIVLALLMLLITRSAFGLQMRAVVQNRRMAASMGIRTGWIDSLTFGLGSGIAGMAGVALSQIDNVSPNLGQGYIIDSFMVVVFGGVGNLWGTLVGAFSLGLANKFLEPFAGAVLAKILILVGIILFIQKRPRGLFALKGRAVES